MEKRSAGTLMTHFARRKPCRNEAALVNFCSSSLFTRSSTLRGGDCALLRLRPGTMVQRLTYRRRHCYATKSNRVRVVKTPGGRLTYQYQKKPTSAPKCGATGVKLQGLKQVRPAKLSNKHLSKKNKTVHRVYGGCLDHKVVRERIIRAFLIEEQKIVKKVMKMKQKGGKADK